MEKEQAFQVAREIEAYSDRWTVANIEFDNIFGYVVVALYDNLPKLRVTKPEDWKNQLLGIEATEEWHSQKHSERMADSLKKLACPLRLCRSATARPTVSAR